MHARFTLRLFDGFFLATADDAPGELSSAASSLTLDSRLTAMATGEPLDVDAAVGGALAIFLALDGEKEE